MNPKKIEKGDRKSVSSYNFFSLSISSFSLHPIVELQTHLSGSLDGGSGYVYWPESLDGESGLLVGSNDVYV